jgi:hypothetical protein
VETILVSFDVDGKRKLFIMLAADGSINRAGGGESDGADSELFVGVSDGSAFQNLAGRLNPAWFKSAGQRFTFPDPRGAQSLLRVILKTSEGEYPLEFSYGLESGGLPADVGNFVQEAVRLTDPWYQEQQALIGSLRKPRWKFW